MGPRFESVKVHQWPVGQVVKTEASHAFNIGSNPVRVTRNVIRRFPVKPALLGFDRVWISQKLSIDKCETQWYNFKAVRAATL